MRGRFCLLLCLLGLGFAGFAQQTKNYLVAYTVKSKDGELTGYKTRDGHVVIPAQFLAATTVNFYKMAIVLNSDLKADSNQRGWVGIDRKGEVMLQVFIYDNGPDYVQDGTFRFVDHGKMGFANLDGRRVIPAVYDFIYPFKGGVAHYIIGGRSVRVDHGEHSVWEGGEDEGYVNRFGQNFSKVSELKGGYREAWINATNQRVLLNGKGKIVKYHR